MHWKNRLKYLDNAGFKVAGNPSNEKRTSNPYSNQRISDHLRGCAVFAHLLNEMVRIQGWELTLEDVRKIAQAIKRPEGSDEYLMEMWAHHIKLLKKGEA